MFGYVKPSAARLSAEEKIRFRSAYCGLCHTLGKRYGFAARFLLNYDFAFLAILLSAGERYTVSKPRCVVHPCRGCPAMEQTAGLCLAADRSVILAWWQLRDHVADHSFFRGLKYRLALLILRRAYRKAVSAAPEFDGAVQARLKELGALESERCASLDRAADPFASLMAEIAEAEPNRERRRILRQLFYHLGRWVYLVDAADDFKRDAVSGNYNPLRYRYGSETDVLGQAEKTAVGEILDMSVRQMAGAYALLDCGEWSGILDSIFYESFYAIGKAVLEGTYRRQSRLLKRNMSEENV